MTPIISIEGLSKTYAGGFQALKAVDLAIRPGEIFALLGPNGAGKTTLIGIVCGLVRASGGRVIADGHDIAKDYRSARAKIGLVPQEISTDAFETVWATMQFSRGLFGKPPNPAHLEQVVAETMHSIRALARDIQRASDVISQLQKESENIGSVLDVIRGIAEQTNLLALNAAIEAARAGEQGRGFAVVADEVRTLASRTQSSTEEIHAMIERLQSGARDAVAVMEQGRRQAEDSVLQAEKAGTSLAEITRAVSVIKDMTNQIAVASREQSQVTGEINRSIGSISEVANSTAEGSKVNLSHCQSMVELAKSVEALVTQFRV